MDRSRIGGPLATAPANLRWCTRLLRDPRAGSWGARTNTQAFLPRRSREELEAKPRSLREVNNEFSGEMLMDKEAFKEVSVYISLPGAIF